jgi:tetratricopeptide (TPR) repeat protein
MLNFLQRRTNLKIADTPGEKMPPTLDELYEQGIDAFNKSEYGIAEYAFLQILNTKPDFADIQNKMGIIYNQTNRLELAVKAFEKALELNPRYTEASLNLAVTLSDRGNYEQAREVFEKAAHFAEKPGALPQDKTKPSKPALDPFVKGKLADEHLRVGKLYYDMGLLDEAIDEYRKALRLAPTFADIITQLGIALRDQGKHNEAIKEFNRAIEINANFIPARLHLGITYYSQGFYGLAEEEWRKALKINPNNSAIKTYLNFVRPQKS